MEGNTIFLSDETIEHLAKGLAKDIVEVFHPEVIIGVKDGGSDFASILKKHLQDIGKYGEIKFLEYSIGCGSLDIKGKEVLLVDDTTFTGTTLKRALYHIAHSDPKTFSSAVLVMCNNSCVIPNFYSIERKIEDQILLPWNPVPGRVYTGGIISKLSPEVATKWFIKYKKELNVLTLLRPSCSDTHYPLKTFIIDDPKKGVKGALAFREGDKELIIEVLSTVPPFKDNQEIITTLWSIILNVNNYHGKKTIVHMVHKKEKSKYEELGFNYIDNSNLEDKDFIEMHLNSIPIEKEK